MTFFASHCRSKTTSERGGYTRTLQGVQEYYYIQEHYKSSTSDVTTPNSLTQPSSTLSSFAIRAPPPPTTYDGSIYLSYNSANSSALQATTSRGVHKQRLFISVQLLLAVYLLTYAVANLCVRSR